MEKIIFMGTPIFAKEILDTLIKEKYNIVGVVTQPDKLVGRKQEIIFSPVKTLALEHQIPVLQPLKIRDDYANILALEPDLIITCAYGQLIPSAVLEAPKYKCVNLHASLLPKLRGGAPIHKAIMDGEEKTGVVLMYMVNKMDAGDMLATKEVKISDDDTYGSLHDKLIELGKDIIINESPKFLKGELVPIQQNEANVTFGYNVSKEEEIVDFTKTHQAIYNHIRALIPSPVSYGIIDGKKIKFWGVIKGILVEDEIESGTIVGFENHLMKIKAGAGYLYISELQIEGKGKVSAKDFENGTGKNYIGKIVNG